MSRQGLRRGIVHLGGSTISAQLIALISLPFLTRLFPPEDFAVLGLFLAVLLPLSAVSALRFNAAIPTAESESDCAGLVSVSLISVSAVSGLLLLLGAGISQISDLNFYTIALLIYSLVAGGVQQIGFFLSLRESAYRRISTAMVGQPLVQTSTQLIFRLAMDGPLPLLVGVAAGASFAALVYARTASSARRISRSEGALLVRKYSNYPRYTTVSTLLSIGMSYVPLVGLFLIYGPHATGIFYIAQKALEAASKFSRNAVGNSFHARAAAAQRLGDSIGALYKHLERYVLSAALAIAGASLTAPWVFPILFGNGWRASGLILALLAPVIGLSFIINSVLPMNMVLSFQRAQLKWDLWLLGGLGAAFATAAVAGAGLAISILLLSIIWSSVLALQYMYYRRQILLDERAKPVGVTSE